MDLNTALMESITSMSEYFVATNTRTSFTELADSATNSLGHMAHPVAAVNAASTNNSSIQANQNSGGQAFNELAKTNHRQLGIHGSNSLTSGQHHQLPSNQHHLNLLISPSENALGNHSGNNCNTNNNNNNNVCNPSNNSAVTTHYSSNSINNSLAMAQQSVSNIQSSRLGQPSRTQIPIHCYIEQLNACSDMPDYSTNYSDNDLFKTANNDPTNKQLIDHTHSSNTNFHLHQSKLALESVTSNNLIPSHSHSSSLVTDNLSSSQANSNSVESDRAQTSNNLSRSSLHNSDNNYNYSSTPTTSNQGLNVQTSSDFSNKKQSFPFNDNNNHHLHSCKETYVIVTSNVLYIDLVRTVLLQLGYSATDLINARATIQIKNWKPLGLDQITDDKKATVGEVLGDISTFVTLRIRLYSSVSQLPAEWNETMIRQVVLALTQTMSQLTLSKLCNISQPLISSIVRGGKKLGRRKCAEFGQWYMNYIKSADARPSSMFCEGGGARLVFDKTREIPRLKAWFANDTKPSDELLEEYSRILNEDALRKDRPQVTPKALRNWWKNERQKLGIRERQIRGRPKLKRID